MDLKKKRTSGYFYLLAQILLPLFLQKGLCHTSKCKDSLETFSCLPRLRGGPQGEEDRGMAVELPLRAEPG